MNDIFDEHAERYSEIIDQSLGRFGAKHDFFVAHKAKLLGRILRRQGLHAKDCRLVDVGCGTAALHKFIDGQFAAIDGVDVSKNSLSVAAQRHPMNRYRLCAGSCLPYEDGVFDIALAVAVFHHVPPGQRSLLVTEILRILRPGGLALVIEHNPFNPVTRHIVSNCELDRGAILLSPSELRGLFRGAGATNVYTRTVLTVPPFREFIWKVDELLGYLPLGAQFYLVARSESSRGGATVSSPPDESRDKPIPSC